MNEPHDPVAVRLSADAVTLQAILSEQALTLPPDELLALLREQCTPFGIELEWSAPELAERLQSCAAGVPLTLLAGTPPGEPVHDRMELAVHVPVGARRCWVRRRRIAVGAGSVLVRLHRGAPGEPGRDIYGRAVAPRLQRRARLPMGTNTRLGEDGATLQAECDGEVFLGNLRVHVAPMRVHRGDVDGLLRSETAVFVDGSVSAGARIEAEQDVHVQGNVALAELTSTAGSISVAGSVEGSARQRSLLVAAKDISCAGVLHADLRAGSDISLAGDARHSTVRANGNVYLFDTLQQSLRDTQVEIGGGVIPLLTPPAPTAVSVDAREVEAKMALSAQAALHGRPPFVFHPCTFEDITAGGGRCRLPDEVFGGREPHNAVLQIKLALPETEGQVPILAHVVRYYEARLFGLTFLQISERDRDRITEFCLRLLRQGKSGTASSRPTRRTAR